MTTRYKRYSINLDDDSHRRFKATADDLSVSMSGLLRMMIKDAFEYQNDHTQHAIEDIKT